MQNCKKKGIFAPLNLSRRENWLTSFRVPGGPDVPAFGPLFVSILSMKAAPRNSSGGRWDLYPSLTLQRYGFYLNYQNFENFFLSISLFFFDGCSAPGRRAFQEYPGRRTCVPSGCFKHPRTRRRQTVRAARGTPSTFQRRRAASVPLPAAWHPPRHICTAAPAPRPPPPGSARRKVFIARRSRVRPPHH